MLKVLIKNRIEAMFASFLGANRKKANGKKSGAGAKILYAILLIYLAVIFLGLFSFVFFSLSEACIALDIAWLYFSLAFMISFVLMFVFSIFMTKSQIYDSKDNELLLSMPIKPSDILISRMTALYIINMLYEAIVLLPAGVIWCIFGRVTPFGAFAFLVIALLLPLFSLALSCLLAWLLAAISTKVKSKTVFTVFFSLLFIGVYMIVYTKAMDAVGNFALYAEDAADALRGISPVYWFGNCVANDRAVQLLLCVLICVLPFIAVFTVLYKSFIKIATVKSGVSVSAYSGKEEKTRSKSAALLHREFSIFFSSATYILNGGIGSIMLIIIGIIAAVKAQSLSEIFEASGMIAALAVCGICFMQSMCLISACSVSMEGKRMYIIKTLPVPSKDIIAAKLKAHIILTLPASLIGVILILAAFGCGILTILCGILCVLCFAPFSAACGLYENIRHPVLDWDNEAVAVKQGMSVLFTMLIQMGITIPFFIGAVILTNFIPAELYMLAAALIFAALSFFTLRALMKKGTAKFDKINA